MSREDGRHMSYNELMECDIFGLLETEMRIYYKNKEKDKKKNQVDIDSAIDFI
ncbi:hypothetical protein [Corticicoccus populi]|uniref:Uncharacterized protein n=1 Tax=Corticicoccus populi TaxID=1812821 RepID=A0ABW5WSA7_9STAP